MIPFKYRQPLKETFEFLCTAAGGPAANKLGAKELAAYNDALTPLQAAASVVESHAAKCPLDLDGFYGFVAEVQKTVKNAAGASPAFDEITWMFVTNTVRNQLFGGADSMDCKAARALIDPTLKKHVKDAELTGFWTTHAADRPTISAVELTGLLKEVARSMTMVDLLRCLQPKAKAGVPPPKPTVAAAASPSAANTTAAAASASPASPKGTPAASVGSPNSPRAPPPPPPTPAKSPTTAPPPPPPPKPTAAPVSVKPTPAPQPETKVEEAAPVVTATVAAEDAPPQAVVKPVDDVPPPPPAQAGQPEPSPVGPFMGARASGGAGQQPTLGGTPGGGKAIPLTGSIQQPSSAGTTRGGGGDDYVLTSNASMTNYMLGGGGHMGGALNNASILAAPPPPKPAMADAATFVSHPVPQPVNAALQKALDDIAAQRAALQQQLELELAEVASVTDVIDSLRQRTGKLQALALTGSPLDVERDRLVERMHQWETQLQVENAALAVELDALQKEQSAAAARAALAARISATTSAGSSLLGGAPAGVPSATAASSARVANFYQRLETTQQQLREKEEAVRRLRALSKQEARLLGEIDGVAARQSGAAGALSGASTSAGAASTPTAHHHAARNGGEGVSMPRQAAGRPTVAAGGGLPTDHQPVPPSSSEYDLRMRAFYAAMSAAQSLTARQQQQPRPSSATTASNPYFRGPSLHHPSLGGHAAPPLFDSAPALDTQYPSSVQATAGISRSAALGRSGKA